MIVEIMNDYSRGIIMVKNILFHFERPRLNRLFSEAVKYPLVIVCAGAGYGKTSAIHDFTKNYETKIAWIQLSERDNVSARFFENFIHTMAQICRPFTQAIGKLSFPDTDDKLSQFFYILREHMESVGYILVFDDFHLIENPIVKTFVERYISEIPPGTSLFLVSRSMPGINIADMISRDRVFSINEDELRFSESELSQYFRQQEISVQLRDLRAIMQDTEGWAFAINLIARSYHKAPGYEGYLRNAMKTNVFQLMESENWTKVSKRLQTFLIRLSLIDHLSVDLIALLAKGDKELLAELDRQSAYVRRDDYISAYLIHHLFLEFLRQKQILLTAEQKQESYRIAAEWCDKNGFKIDALVYYEKVGDYGSIVRIFFELPTQVPQGIARYAAGIFERAPADIFDRVTFLAVMHVRVAMCLGLWQEVFRLLEYYEEKYLKLPGDDDFRNQNLGGLYYCWGIMRTLMCTIDDCYDFDLYYEKMDECLSKAPVEIGQIANHPCGPWISLVGSSREGAPQDFIDSFTRATYHASHCLSGAMTGLDDLARGELKFYQGDNRAAEALIINGLERAREQKQFETEHRALLYLLRIAISQGDLTKAGQALSDIEGLLGENEYSIRFITYDIALAWYFCVLGMPERVPDWLREKFAPYGHAYFIENFGNQVKARYFYLTKNYPLLLAYIDELKRRESVLYGRVEMLAMEACIHYKMKDRKKALATLQEAWEEAAPNNILKPFMGLGKDMRTLTASAMKEPDYKVPKAWLEEVNRKSASYAKRQSHIIAEYKQLNHIEETLVFSQREIEILTDLSHGLSRKEIAVSRGISVNTVKMIISIVYSKLGAENLADLIRFATERKMI